MDYIFSVKFSEIVLNLNFYQKNISGKGLKKTYQEKTKIFTPKMCKKNDMLRKKNHIRKRVAKKTYQEKAKIFTFFPVFSKLFSARL
jgi:hypothetical protein